MSNKVIPSSNIQYPARESEIKKSKLTTIPQNFSGTSLLGNIGNISNISNVSNVSPLSNMSKKSTIGKERLLDLGDFGSPYSTKNR